MKAEKRKGRWLRVTLRVLAVLIVIFIIACFVFDHYVQFRKPDEEMRADFDRYGINAKLSYYEAGGRKLRYASTEGDSLPLLLFLHGSPGSMSYYSRRFADSAIASRFRMIAVDRPGYGYSGFGDAEPSIQKQAAMIRPLLDSLHATKHPVIVVGSSFGAAIASRITMDYPHLVDGLLLTGPAIGPGQERYFWFTYIVESPLVNWFIPRIFKPANTEKVHHREELEKMLPLWKNIKVPVVYLQGENDEIVDTSNASFARRQLVNAPYLDIRMIPGRGHRLAQFEWPQFRQGILDLYDRVKK